ncbi:MAG: allantoate amidohydrolase, partial [Bifidobacteriaceae bacterium]|nr:allantoate amidohydrolase [Bifidobacteriaceae bacterium]
MTGPDAAGLLGEIAGIGREGEGGGYSRHVFDASEMALREWFADRASRAGLRVEADGNANLWAWCGAPGDGAVLTGSHLDSVPGGGAFDGPLGVASALEVVARWRRRGHVPAVPFAVVVFAEEEGGRFGLPCAGSRLAAGTVAPSEVLTRRDRDGVTFAEAARRAGFDPALCGPVPRLTHAAAFVEVHIEQGRALADLDRPVAIARSIAAHGRWRVEFTGEANHAGTTRMADRADPVVALAALIQAARAHATRLDARATVGRVAVAPGGTNVIASTARGWLDARAGDSAAVHRLVEAITAAAREAATAEGTRVEIVAES